MIDLKPENLLFKTQAEDADIMIADFGLSRVMEEEKLNLLTEICGTPGVSVSSHRWIHVRPSNQRTLVHGTRNLQAQYVILIIFHPIQY